MAKPTTATISKLYCVSRNRCAYPDCPTPLFEPTSQVLMSEVCHIKAESPGGPRFDSLQTDDERHGFANLIIMCRNHHKVIDTDVSTWTVAKLLQLKADHEKDVAALPDPPEKIVSELLATVVEINVGSVQHGSVITTINQSGGQVAHQIVNQGDPKRTISADQASDLVQRLSAFAPETFFVMAPQGHGEAHLFGEALARVLKAAGWSNKDTSVGQLMGADRPVRPGVNFLSCAVPAGLATLIEWCKQEGFRPSLQTGKLPDLYWPDRVNILVGPAPEDR